MTTVLAEGEAEACVSGEGEGEAGTWARRRPVVAAVWPGAWVSQRPVSGPSLAVFGRLTHLHRVMSIY